MKCPVAGKFNFTQKGERDLLLRTRILGGVTEAPWDNIYCRENISDFSVCDKDQKEIQIDVNYCITVDAYGRQVDIYSKFFQHFGQFSTKFVSHPVCTVYASKNILL